AARAGVRRPPRHGLPRRARHGRRAHGHHRRHRSADHDARVGSDRRRVLGRLNTSQISDGDYSMFRKLTIKAKLSFVIGVMSLLIGIIGLLGMKGMLDMERGLQTIYSDQLLPSQQIGTINDLMRGDIES